MLKVDDLMTIDPDVVAPDVPLRKAIVIMNEYDVRQLPVVKAGKLVGIITDRDIRLAVNSPLVSEEPLERLELINGHKVESAMTTNPVTVTPDMPIYKVADLMATFKYGALPVVNGEDLVGIITVTDLLRQMALKPKPD